ncbi:TPA: ATP-binding cassette domain-containing protein, partial [Streptococcus agalactiae]|nr:ATP-binding cassette domain-containing protein [Streptococcus agalactiae]
FELSGGMLQRIMLATILSLDPQVIILDEPTSAVDCHNCSTISAILQELQNNGKTLITVTHDYQLARDLGGQLLVISEGEVVEQGQTQTILSNPQHNYTKALTVQMEYEGDILNVGL